MCFENDKPILIPPFQFNILGFIIVFSLSYLYLTPPTVKNPVPVVCNVFTDLLIAPVRN